MLLDPRHVRNPESVAGLAGGLTMQVAGSLISGLAGAAAALANALARAMTR